MIAMSENPEELSKLVKDTLSAIKNGISDNGIVVGSIKFDLAIIKTKNIGGRLEVIVASIGGKYEKEVLSRISFEVKPSLTSDDSTSYNV